jgi:hypothetical protein
LCIASFSQGFRQRILPRISPRIPRRHSSCILRSFYRLDFCH